MAELDKLVVQLEASLVRYERELRRANGVTDKRAREIEKRFSSMSQRINRATAGIGQQIVPSLGAIGAALSVREVARYADAWTRAKNSLAVAGVVGREQKAVLDELYNSAQRNAAPLEALTSVYGKAAQASKELGADQASLLKFTDGVSVALKVAGTDAASAQGALLQLGQALGSARVQAEEFNSLNEGARPILIAVANGLDKAGGSVSKLKQLVNDGEVSNKTFFNSFLRGLPTIQAMAANSTQTLEQGFVKVSNAMTRYVGQTDEGLGATTRLAQGLNALADDFDTVADYTLKVAGVIAAALVGRALGGMLATLGKGTAELARFVLGLRAAGSVAGISAAVKGLGIAAGPVGATLMVGASAVAYFASQSDHAAKSADRYADALKRAREGAKSAGAESKKTGDQFVETETNRLVETLKKDETAIKAVEGRIRVAIEGILRDLRKQPGGSESPIYKALKAIIEPLNGTTDGAIASREALNKLANSNSGFQGLADRINPLNEELEGMTRSARELADELAKIGKLRNPFGGFRAAEDQSMGRLQEARTTGQAVLDEAKRRNDLTDTQRAVEDRVAELTKAVEEVGGIVDRAAITAQATREVQQRETSKLKSSSAPIETARKLVGMNETRDRDLLGQFMRDANVNVDPKKTAWCAAFVNAVLATNGLPGNGSLSARSFLNYGEKADTPQVGDIVVLKRGTGNEGHVGFYEGRDTNGNIRVTGGNQGGPRNGGGGVSTASYNAADVLGYRRIPGAAAGDDRTLDMLTEERDRRIDLKQAIDDVFNSVTRQTEAMEGETATIGMSTQEREKARIAMELEQALRDEGITNIDAYRQKIDQVAEAYARAAAAGEDMARGNAEAIARMDEMRDFSGDLLKGFVSDLRNGKDAGEAFANVLGKIADKMIDMAINQLIGGLMGEQGTPAGGGLLGGLFKAFGFAKGGIAAHGKPVPLPRFAKGGVSRSAAIFGEAGPEAAVPLPDGRRIPVDLRVPSIPTARTSGKNNGGMPAITYAPQVDARGADTAAIARLERAMAEDRRDFSARVVETVRAAQQTRNI